jgi:hypothetical protein
MHNKPIKPTLSSLRFVRAAYGRRCRGRAASTTLRMIIRRLLGAARLTTMRMQQSTPSASKLASGLAADPQH